MPEANRQSPTPSQGGEGSDLKAIAGQIEGILDDDGHYNPSDRVSRAHPDYDGSLDESPTTAPGRDEKGRFRKKAETTDESTDDNIEATDAETPVDDLDEDAASEDASDTDEDQDDSAVEDTDDEAEDTDPIQTLAEMAAALEVPIEELKESLTHTFTAAGEEMTVTLAELEKGYQKDADYRRSTATLAEKTRAHEQEYATRVQMFDMGHQQLAGQMNAMEQVIVARLNDPKLAELRQRDPGEWTARREELGQELGYLRQARQQASQQYQETINTNLAGVKARSMEALKEALPDFGTKQADTAKEVMSSLGYAPEEVSKIFDHRVVLGALEMHRLRTENAALKKEKETAIESVKKVKKTIPALMKPGAARRKSAAGLSRDNVAKLAKRAKQTGRVEDAAKVIEQFI